MSSIKLFEFRLKKEGSEVATKCSQLKMQSAGYEAVTTCHGLKMVAPDRRARLIQSKSVKPVVTRKNAKRPGIIRALKDWPQIEFTDDRKGNQFRVTLKRLEVQLPAVSDEMSGKMSGKMSEKIFTALKDDPQSTIAELAAKVGATTRTVERNLKKLQQESRVARIGPDNGGYWKVISPP